MATTCSCGYTRSCATCAGMCCRCGESLAGAAVAARFGAKVIEVLNSRLAGPAYTLHLAALAARLARDAFRAAELKG